LAGFDAKVAVVHKITMLVVNILNFLLLNVSKIFGSTRETLPLQFVIVSVTLPFPQALQH
jgi:hypothetical protein